MNSSRKNFRDDWLNAWRSSAFKIRFTVTLVMLLFLGASINKFFVYIQSRPGIRIHDPLLDQIAAHEMSSYIFFLIYAGITIGIIHLLQFPTIFLRTAQAYCLLTLMRITTLFLIPLEPSDSIIPLNDPIVDNFFYGENIITKDLFFSGHVSTMVLFVFATPNRLLKYFFVAVSVLIALLTLIQHAHYTIDILAAPLFSWIVYRLIGFDPDKAN